MKRTALMFGLAALVLIVGTQVWAQGPHRHGQSASQATWQQRQQFAKDTESIRQNLWEKQDQLRALLDNPESDPAAIGTLEKDIYQLRGQLRDKAQAAGLCPKGGPGFGRGWGCGHGMGYGYGGCW
jgi:septal ring factor EnvC (AmiA/AmiB activator)